MTICHGSNGERISFTESNTIFAALLSVMQGLGVYSRTCERTCEQALSTVTKPIINETDYLRLDTSYVRFKSSLYSLLSCRYNFVHEICTRCQHPLSVSSNNKYLA